MRPSPSRDVPMLDDVTEIETPDIQPNPRAPASSKAAIKYLIASGASAISITSDIDGAAISAGTKPDPDAVAIFWLPAAKARSVATRARHIAGDNPDVDEAISAVREAAANSQATLTEHDIAVSRAGEAAKRLDRFMELATRHRHSEGIHQRISAPPVGGSRERSRLHELRQRRGEAKAGADPAHERRQACGRGIAVHADIQRQVIAALNRS